MKIFILCVCLLLRVNLIVSLCVCLARAAAEAAGGRTPERSEAAAGTAAESERKT